MAAYHIQLWRGEERIFGCVGETFSTLEAVNQHVDSLLREMMAESYQDDCTGCRLAVTTELGRPVREIPVLPAMSALARRTRH